MPEPWKEKNAPDPQRVEDKRIFMKSGLLSDSRHFSPRLPNHQDVATQHLVLGSEA
jgi:hypothetical protein